MQKLFLVVVVLLLIQFVCSHDAFKVVDDSGQPVNVQPDAIQTKKDAVTKNCEFTTAQKITCKVNIDKQIMGNRINLNATFSNQVDYEKKTTRTVIHLDKAYEPVHDKTAAFSELNNPQCFDVSKVTCCLHFTDVKSSDTCFKVKMSLGMKVMGNEMQLLEPQALYYGDGKC
jgi:hypothetical protein